MGKLTNPESAKYSDVLHALYEIARVLRQDVNKEVLYSVLEIMREYMDLNTGSIVLFGKNESDNLNVNFTDSASPFSVARDLPDVNALFPLLEKGHPLIIPDDVDNVLIHDSFNNLENRHWTYICLPVPGSSRIKGILISGQCFKGDFGLEDHMYALGTIAEITGKSLMRNSSIPVSQEKAYFIQEPAIGLKRQQPGAMVGTSANMQAVFSGIDQMAGVNSSVLLLGEHGTGKTLAAEAIHHKSTRAEKPFITVSSAARGSV